MDEFCLRISCVWLSIIRLNELAMTADVGLQKRIDEAALRLSKKLTNVDLASLPVSDYTKKYISDKLPNLDGVLELYGSLIHLAIRDSNLPPEKMTLVDYGGGSGMISFLAAELGIGTVIYTDIYDVSCADVKVLASGIDVPLGHVVEGDVNDLISYLRRRSLTIDAIVSFDVIEHIYDVGAHFKSLSALADQTFRVVYASSANAGNPLYVRSISKTQIDVETKTREMAAGHKERDALRAYLDIRRQIIADYAPDLTAETADTLASETRGLIKADIERCVDEFRAKGEITYRVDHPTNTCDPLTGNWCEHLMDFIWIKRTLTNAGFDAEIKPHPYNSHGPTHKRAVKQFLNTAIRVLGRSGFLLSPYYVVNARFPGKRA